MNVVVRTQRLLPKQLPLDTKRVVVVHKLVLEVTRSADDFLGRRFLRRELGGDDGVHVIGAVAGADFVWKGVSGVLSGL